MKGGKFESARDLICWGVGLLMLVTVPALAAGGGNKGMAAGINYIPITPPLVVNYGGPGKSRYIKAELSIRSENATDATIVTHNLPLIRDRLVSILSAQTEEIVNSVEGKEYLRLYALAEINKALLQVQGVPLTASAGAMGSAQAVLTSTQASDTTAAVAQDSSAAASATAIPEVASLPVVTPVQGPASDLYFNNFVVQK
jgi:flagellar FliL protein